MYSITSHTPMGNEYRFNIPIKGVNLSDTNLDQIRLEEYNTEVQKLNACAASSEVRGQIRVAYGQEVEVQRHVLEMNLVTKLIGVHLTVL